MKNLFTSLVLVTCLSATLCGQEAAPAVKHIHADTLNQKAMIMDAVYSRPMIRFGNFPVAIGGFASTNYEYLGTAGETEGHLFSMPGATLFLTSSLHKKIKFLTEIEFAEGGKKVSVDFAALDINFHSLLNFRGGIILNPIGAFNQNHDDPKWDFIDRPVSMTQLLPGTWSNVGFGLYGKQYAGNWGFGYEGYVTNGFDNSIITNTQNKTYLPAAKENEERFNGNNNGQPLITGKFTLRNSKIGEVGVSYMGGIYNKFKDGDLALDSKRRAEAMDINLNAVIPVLNTSIVGEWVWIKVDVPEIYGQQFGNKQYGRFIDIVQPMIKTKMFGFAKATISVGCRFEYVDWNVGNFLETNSNIYDDYRSIIPTISFRPVPSTVLRVNYKYSKQKDILGNPAAITSGIQAGFATYF